MSDLRRKYPVPEVSHGMNNGTRDKVKISFILPAFNEEKHIGLALESIHENMAQSRHEIIVVDNGSHDSTPQIARAKGATVLVQKHVTISSLRNLGVSYAKGDIIAFIDADVHLGNDWGEVIWPIISRVGNNPMILTGSTYDLPDEATWLEKCWYGPILQSGELSHINGGHLVLSKELFLKVGGFKEDLVTGEDYEFCQRAKELGAIIVHDAKLKAIHEGYPKSIAAFLRRERWHGRGDYLSLRTIAASKPALLSIGQICVLCLSLLLAVFCRDLSFLFIYPVFLGVIGISAAALRCRHALLCLPACALLYIIYFWGRGLAFFDVMLAIPRGKRGRNIPASD